MGPCLCKMRSAIQKFHGPQVASAFGRTSRLAASPPVQCRGFVMESLKEIFSPTSPDELYVARQVKNMKDEDQGVVRLAAKELKGMSDDIPGAGKNAGLLSNDRRNMGKTGAIRQCMALLINADDAETRSHCSKILRNLSSDPITLDLMVSAKKVGADHLKKMHVNMAALIGNLDEDIVYDPSSGKYVYSDQVGIVQPQKYQHHW